eukprot:09686_5
MLSDGNFKEKTKKPQPAEAQVNSDTIDLTSHCLTFISFHFFLCIYVISLMNHNAFIATSIIATIFLCLATSLFEISSFLITP